MKNKWIIGVFLVIGLIFPSCSGFMAPAPPIEGSIINQHIPDLKQADFLLTLANLQLIEQGVYTKEEVEMFFDGIEVVLQTKITYADLAAYLVRETDQLQEQKRTFILVSSYVELFQNEIVVINDVDKALIQAHIQNQRMKVLALF